MRPHGAVPAAEDVARVVETAVAEDRCDHDITTAATVAPGRPARAELVAREVDSVASGELTHSARVLEFSMRLLGEATPAYPGCVR